MNSSKNNSAKKKINRLILATHNNHKTEEVKNILKGINVKVVSLEEINWTKEIVEDGDAFHKNAELKVLAVAKEYSNDYILADDSGLVVNCLNGAPGVNSARYAGNDRSSKALCNKLIAETSKFSEENRAAFFITVLAFYQPYSKRIVFFEGRVEGLILSEMIGSNGFGYDPVFYVPAKRKTMAELSPTDKNLLSHRYNALVKFQEYFGKQDV